MRFYLFSGIIYSLFSSLLYGNQTGVYLSSQKPAFTLRCDALLKKKNQKIKYKQQLESILNRNYKLQKRTPLDRPSVISKLKNHFFRAKEEVNIAILRITQLEENIVRTGCASISLRESTPPKIEFLKINKTP